MNKKIVIIIILIACTSLHAYDILLEGKGAYFLSTDRTFKNIYNNGGGAGGVEFTAGTYKNLYGFISADVFHKKGNSLGLCDETKVTFVELGLGLKYFIPFRFGDVYVGLGALPTYLRTEDCSPFVIQQRTKWGCGGIGKLGVYFNLPHSFIVDLFVNYAFVKIPFECCFNGCTQSHDARLNGWFLGGGLGYRFN